jgi:hypothetical protein
MSPQNDICCYLDGWGKTKCPLPGRQRAFHAVEVSLLLIAALVARLAKQLAVLLLGHTLATLLNN